jgi:hypothetical protein
MTYNKISNLKACTCLPKGLYMSAKKTLLVMVAIAFPLLFSTQAAAVGSTSGLLMTGFRAGVSDDRGIEFVQYEIFAVHRLPWQGQGPGSWRWSVRLEGTAALLRGAGKEALVSTLGPALALFSPTGLWTIDGGSSVAYLSRYRFADKHLGGNLQFISHLGVEYLLQPELGLGYRVQHMSNADLYPENPGVDLHLLQFSYHFL